MKRETDIDGYIPLPDICTVVISKKYLLEMTVGLHVSIYGRVENQTVMSTHQLAPTRLSPGHA